MDTPTPTPAARRFDLVMFDLDGTLVATAPEIADAVNDTLRRFALPPVGEAQATLWIGHGSHRLLAQAVASASGTDVAVARAAPTWALIAEAFDTFYRQRCGTRSAPYPQVRQTLDALRSQGVKLAVVTNKEHHHAQTVLAAHHLDGLFDLVLGGDTAPAPKPDPGGILHCLDVFAVRPARALFVGDSSIDVAAARNAQVPVWALSYGYNGGQPIHASRPERVIDGLAALLEPGADANRITREPP